MKRPSCRNFLVERVSSRSVRARRTGCRRSVAPTCRCSVHRGHGVARDHVPPAHTRSFSASTGQLRLRPRHGHARRGRERVCDDRGRRRTYGRSVRNARRVHVEACNARRLRGWVATSNRRIRIAPIAPLHHLLERSWFAGRGEASSLSSRSLVDRWRTIV